MVGQKWRARFSQMCRRCKILKLSFYCALLLLLNGCGWLGVNEKTPTVVDKGFDSNKAQTAFDSNKVQTAFDSNKAQTVFDSNKVQIAEVVKPPVSAETDLWRYISNRHSLKGRSQKDLFWHIDWFKKHPDYLTRVTKRATPYLYFITKEVEKAGLPIELALLPIVESAYYPFSFSHSRASGLWQFIPATGKLYGLKQNYWTDQRRSVVLSTRAAIAYLKSLNSLFKGDWLLAIAAYNSGPGRVQRAVKRNKAAGKKADFWHISLPAETKGYVPRLLAVAELIKNPQKYNQIITPVKNKPKLESVYLYSQLDLALIAQWSGLSLEEIYTLNPDLNRWATPQISRYELLLPIDKVAAFKQARGKYPKHKRLNYKRYQVRAGDSLAKLAKKFNSSIAYIKSINNLSNSIIKLGQQIIIPIPQKPDDYYTMSQSQREAQRLNNEKHGKKIIHQVVKGESLWLIANKYSVQVDDIIEWNHLINATKALQVGKKLVIWQLQKITQEALKGLAKVNININRTVFYKIKSGDNLSTIARKFGVSVAKIVKTNKLNKNQPLKIGRKLKIIKAIAN